MHNACLVLGSCLGTSHLSEEGGGGGVGWCMLIFLYIISRGPVLATA